jgi:SAM-dependent methyltransferase
LEQGQEGFFKRALDAGSDIYGIDISESMQNYLKQRIQTKDHFKLKFADVRNFDFSKKFNLIIAPFRIFSHLVTIEDQLSAMKNIYNHLETGGRFTFDVFLPDLSVIDKGINNSLQFEGEYAPGKLLKRYDSVVPDYVNQVLHITYRFVWEDDGLHEEINEFPFRYYFRYELEHLIARSYFKLDKMYGDFQYGELSNSSKNMVCVCSKN